MEQSFEIEMPSLIDQSFYEEGSSADSFGDDVDMAASVLQCMKTLLNIFQLGS